MTRFVLAVGHDHMDGNLRSQETRLRTKLLDAVVDYLVRQKVAMPMAIAAGELAVKDKLAKPGVTVVYLTGEDISRYLAQATRRRNLSAARE